MSDNFKIAARRHHNDAEYLKQAGKKANAGQLFGLAAECGIKAVIEGLTHAYPHKHFNTGLLQPTHINLLNSQFVQGRSSNYLAIIPNIQKFSDWSVNQRYWDDASIPNSLEDWRSASTEVMMMLDVAIVDGKL